MDRALEGHHAFTHLAIHRTDAGGGNPPRYTFCQGSSIIQVSHFKSFLTISPTSALVFLFLSCQLANVIPSD